MTSYILPMMIVLTLLALIVLGISAIAWQASMPSETLSPAQIRLLDIAEWMLKGAFLSLLGYLAGLGMNIRN